MTARTCATCTHWLHDDDILDTFEEWCGPDRAMAADMIGWRPCQLFTNADSGGEQTRNRAGLAFAYTTDSYIGADLFTAPEFGCLQWEEKPS